MFIIGRSIRTFYSYFYRYIRPILSLIYTHAYIAYTTTANFTYAM